MCIEFNLISVFQLRHESIDDFWHNQARKYRITPKIVHWKLPGSTFRILTFEAFFLVSISSFKHSNRQKCTSYPQRMHSIHFNMFDSMVVVDVIIVCLLWYLGDTTFRCIVLCMNEQLLLICFFDYIFYTFIVVYIIQCQWY